MLVNKGDDALAAHASISRKTMEKQGRSLRKAIKTSITWFFDI